MVLVRRDDPDAARKGRKNFYGSPSSGEVSIHAKYMEVLNMKRQKVYYETPDSRLRALKEQRRLDHQAELWRLMDVHW